ncbi:hypothetical protein DID74_00695 [Candidatus Marinamargulisbacteria bacterium SCGC AG-333-B06]|nr:hypothetical protein DID74_00695 [Candidatus Marinamargulisbacteria bacterium SCGC AG-333-B06]
MKSLINEFEITEKHYKTLIKQGLDNLPYETGGFLGGKKGQIQAILPTFNKDWDQNKDVYALANEDIQRAHAFFKKHGLIYYAVYHTHPNGIPYPSEADIATGQQYHFILSYKDDKFEAFNCFRIDNRVPTQLPLRVIPDKGFDSKELKKKVPLNNKETKQDVISDEDDLNQRMHNILDDKQNKYEKRAPKDGELNSDFSTFA